MTTEQKAIAWDCISSRIDVLVSDDITDEPDILENIGQYAMWVYDYTQDPKIVLSEISDCERANLYKMMDVWGYWYVAIKESIEKELSDTVTKE